MFNLALIPFRVFLFSLLVFALLRLGYYLIYTEYFETLTLGQVVTGFLWGMRFDLAITGLLAALFLLPLLWPLNFRWRTGLIQSLLWLVFVLLALGWAVNLGDLLYFGEVFRHAGRELILLTQDYVMLLELALGSRLVVLLLGMAGLVVLGVLWHFFVVRPALQPLRGHWRVRVLLSFLVLVLLIIAVRGGMLSGKPLSLVDAYALGTEEQAALSLNGTFAVIHSARRALKDDRPPLSFFSTEEMAARSSRYLAGEDDPFVRSWSVAADADVIHHKNVVMILLESWSYRYIDALAGTSYGVTPNMDALISQSRVWENAYAAGQRSIEGIQAILTSVPLLDSQPVIGWGLEQNRMTRLASLLADLGYESVMVQSSNRRSFHMDGIAATLGFDHYFGKEDLPLLLDYPEEIPRFGWDYEALMFLESFLAQRQAASPFFAFLFTGTTHEPFPDPGAQFHRYDHEKDDVSAYLNTLFYSDWALGEFMQKVSLQPWYEDTVFVFVADHVLRASAESLEDSFRIPMLLFTPDQTVPAGREQRFASQYDMLPTLMDLLDINQPIAAFGQSLLQDKSHNPDGIVIQRGSATGWIAPEGSFLFDRQSVLSPEGQYVDESVRSLVEDWLKWRLQLADQRLLRNEWLRQE